MTSYARETIGLSVFLSNMLKAILKIVYFQIESFLKDKLSKLLTGFRIIAPSTI